MPKVSVIIPTYDRWKSLMHCISSIQSQTFKDVEIIIVNDCSTEEEYKQQIPYVQKIDLPINMRKLYNVNAAQGMTRNEGLKIATGEWICFLDDDDCYLPTKLERQLEILQKTGLKMSCTNGYAGYGLYNPETLYPYYYNSQKHLMEPSYYSGHFPPNVIKKDLLAHINYVINSSVMIHKTILEKTGGFNIGINEDWDLWKRCSQYTDILYIDEPLVYYDLGHAGGQKYSYAPR